ncbi:MAG TPA: AIR synthase related protein [Actinomycetales bacterium]|nr:AIR synthase related protein [Actinomycetales bacterium]
MESPLPSDARSELATLTRTVREHPGLHAKSVIGMVSDVFGPSDWLSGPGDDGAAVSLSGTNVIACGEALYPPFVAADPFGAGVAAVLTNVNDLAAMGAIPLGIVDTIVAEESVARTVLEGMRHACELYAVPLLGGHLTRHPGQPSVSAFGLGHTARPLSVANVRPGQHLVVACATEGDMRTDFPFFRSFEVRGGKVAGDVRVLHQVSGSGACVAAKDISMAGLVGSLAMLLESGRFGVTVDLEALPQPADVPLERWLTCFPSFGFLLCVPPGRQDDCLLAFDERGLEAAVVGEIDSSGEVALRRGPDRSTAIDLSTGTVTGLNRAFAVSRPRTHMGGGSGRAGRRR